MRAPDDLLAAALAADHMLVLLVGFAASAGMDEPNPELPSADELVIGGVKASKQLRAAIAKATGAEAEVRP